MPCLCGFAIEKRSFIRENSGKTIHDLVTMSITDLLFILSADLHLLNMKKPWLHVCFEIMNRLHYLQEVGLEYFDFK